MKSRFSLELTLAILKPPVIKNPVVLQKIRDVIIHNGFKVMRSRRTTITIEEAGLFYQEHQGKFFYNRLVTFMCSGPSDIHILAGQNAISKWRELMGPTKVYQAQYSAPDSIRGKYGLSDTRNATHGSDSPESATREIKIFFTNFDLENWNRTEDNLNHKWKLDGELSVHKLDESPTDSDQHIT